ncbi:MAG: crossover junction endodeoxyribonuclease RuvC [Gammaproteobacteria bacterium]
MVRILGIDPGSWATGYGVIQVDGQRIEHIASGCIRGASTELPQRLKRIFDGVLEVVDRHRPDELVVEKVFINRNPDSALKLGQARGVALVAAALRELPVHEFTPAEIKLAVVGKGNAAKAQIQHMVTLLLRLREQPGVDAADALAVAICRGHTRHCLQRLGDVRGRRAGRWV